MGNGSFSPNSPIKGHRRCPGTRKMLHALKKRPNCDYLMVDEFKTSQVCGLCFNLFGVGTKLHRFKVCKFCIPLQVALPAKRIITTLGKRALQFERRIARGVMGLVAMNIDGRAAAEAHPNQQQRRLVSKITQFDKTVPLPRNVDAVDDEEAVQCNPVASTSEFDCIVQIPRLRSIVWHRDISAAKIMIYKGTVN